MPAILIMVIKKKVWDFLSIFRFAIFEVIKSTFRFAFYDFSF